MGRPRLAATFVVILALTGGCAFLREAIGLGPQNPKVQLADVEVVNANLASLELMVTIRVDNPNDFDLNFSKLRYNMVAGGLAVASGTLDDQVSVPASGHSLIKLPLAIDAGNALKLAHDLLTKTTETFAVLTATADFDTPFGAMAVSFEDKRPLKKLAGF
jgi:LEA14-like dessication related protein